MTADDLMPRLGGNAGGVGRDVPATTPSRLVDHDVSGVAASLMMGG